MDRGGGGGGVFLQSLATRMETEIGTIEIS